MGGKYQTVVVAVGHDECAHEACGDAPAGSPGIFFLVLLVNELNVEGTSEVLSEEVAGTALQCLTVLHHGFDGIGVEGSGKTFGLALHTAYNGDGEDVACKIGIDVEHEFGAFLCLLAGGMCGMAFLPEEFRGAEEEACTHFPAHDVAPLVAEHGEVAPGVDPVLVGVPDDGFRSGSDDEFLFETCSGVYYHSGVVFVRLQTVVGDDGTFLGEAFNVFGLAREVALGNKQWEIGILHTRLLETEVEFMLKGFPDGIAIGLDDHASAHVGLFGKVGFYYQFVIPTRIVDAAFGKVFEFFCHLFCLVFRRDGEGVLINI